MPQKLGQSKLGVYMKNMVGKGLNLVDFVDNNYENKYSQTSKHLKTEKNGEIERMRKKLN